MSYRYDRTGERVDQDDERTDEQATLDHVAEVRRILQINRPRGRDVHLCSRCGAEYPATSPRPTRVPLCRSCADDQLPPAP